jgi:signal peptidase I
MGRKLCDGHCVCGDAVHVCGAHVGRQRHFDDQYPAQQGYAGSFPPLYQPSRGDIVVVTKPNSENEPLIKRVIALEGQTVDIDFSKGIVYVDGEALDEPYVNTPTNLRYDVKFPITVPKGDLFVLGDNRNGSLDSRSSRIGFIDTRYVLGKVYLRIFPLGAFELFK